MAKISSPLRCARDTCLGLLEPCISLRIIDHSLVATQIATRNGCLADWNNRYEEQCKPTVATHDCVIGLLLTSGTSTVYLPPGCIVPSKAKDDDHRCSSVFFPPEELPINFSIQLFLAYPPVQVSGTAHCNTGWKFLHLVVSYLQRNGKRIARAYHVYIIDDNILWLT